MKVRINDLLALNYMPIIVEDADGKHYAKHHTSYVSGYHPTGYNTVKPYFGKYGVGYTVEQWANGTGNFHRITYYIESDGE